MAIVTADDYKRVRLPDAKPGQAFEYTVSGNGAVKLTPVRPVDDDVPVVKLIRGPDGDLCFPEGAKLTREQIRAAVRADRDAR
jgi:hypothetical protein